MEPRFLADQMLGKVGRWLALLGFDAAWAREGEGDDQALLERAQRENRVFLTRDTKIPPVRGVRVIVIREQRFEDQLAGVIRETGLVLDPGRFFSRCANCNRELIGIDRTEALQEAPPRVGELETAFHRCPACRRLYWPGTHTARVRKKLEQIGLL